MPDKESRKTAFSEESPVETAQACGKTTKGQDHVAVGPSKAALADRPFHVDGNDVYPDCPLLYPPATYLKCGYVYPRN